MKKAKDMVFGGALALQSTNLLKDRSTAGLTNTMEGFMGIGITGAMANASYKMVSFKSKPKAKQYRKQFQTKYGYKPKMFVKNNSYIFVKPKGLKKI